MEIGLVRKVDIDHEMQQSYLDYAMSVIVSRALPDARDGLKPVQRRILYAMYDMGLRPDTPYKKSARIVGEVLGKYHPHGDMAVYEAMARLAQDFTMRYPEIDGQGNFGSIDGDPPAAMRYTEARLMPFSMELLAQIERNTVDFEQNFDGTLTEPAVLPAAAPNLLVNGANGIAVGMATSIPPHNLGEVIDALIYLLKQWDKLDDVSITDLMHFVKGPDFPTGGIILQESDKNELLSAYATGRGRVTVRGRVHMEEMSRGRNRLIISELPYQVNKSTTIERIAELVREGGLDGIADLRDESDRQGMRIVIELNKAAEPDEVLRQLYRRTPLQSTFSINMLALVDGEPRLLSLKHALKVYLEHRLEVTRRRSQFDLERARQRAHILEGLRTALSHLDEVIVIIRNSPDSDKARSRLMSKYKLSEVQAQAILDMPLKRLAALERKKIEQEYKDLLNTIKELEALLRSAKKMRQQVEAELLAIKETYNDRRRTQIVALKDAESAALLLTTADLTPAKATWVGIMADGTIARSHTEEQPRLTGRQAPRWVLKTDTHHTLYLVAESGRTAAVAVQTLPEAETFAEGVALSKLSPLEAKEKLAAVFSLPAREEVAEAQYVLTVSRQGMVKKSLLTELPGPSAYAFTLVKVNPGDALVGLMITGGEDELLLATANGMSIRFSESEVRPMGLAAAGVAGIKLGPGDAVIGAEKIQRGEEVVLLSAQGKGWRIPPEEFPLQGRYGQGTIAVKLAKGDHLAGMLAGKRTQTGIVHFKGAAARLIRPGDVAATKRLRAGEETFAVKAADAVVRVSLVMDWLGFWSAARVKKQATPRKRAKRQ